MTKIEKFMKENQLSKKELAKICKVGVYSVENLIQGKNLRQATDILFNIAVATKIRVEDLLEERRKT